MPNFGKAKAKPKKPHRKPALPPPSAANPNRIIPREILSNILSRLPVKTLVQLRSVCKRWRSLISNPKFISFHSTRSQSYVFFHMRGPAITALMRSAAQSAVSSGRITITHEIPRPTAARSVPNFNASDVSGSVNGVVLMSRPPWGRDLVLWNPITQASRSVSFPGPGPDPSLNSRVSVGLGFDPCSNDYKIVLIMSYHKGLGIPDTANVYSWRSGRWKEVKPGIKFWVVGTRCEAVIEGMPYWRAVEKDAVGVRPVLVYFDSGKDGFDLVSLPWVMKDTNACVGEFRGCLGMVVWPKKAVEGGRGQVFDVWIMDTEENGWSKKLSIGPIVEFDRVVGFDEDRGVIGEDGEGTLLTYYFDTAKIKECCFVRAPGRGTIDVVRFRESMVAIV